MIDLSNLTPMLFQNAIIGVLIGLLFGFAAGWCIRWLLKG